MTLLDAEDPAKQLHARAVNRSPLMPGRARLWLGVLRRYTPEQSMLDELDVEILVVSNGSLFTKYGRRIRRRIEADLEMLPPLRIFESTLERTSSPG